MFTTIKLLRKILYHFSQLRKKYFHNYELDQWHIEHSALSKNTVHKYFKYNFEDELQNHLFLNLHLIIHKGYMCTNDNTKAIF